ncbi:MAG: prefoldin subunit beta [Methanomicrobiales archaeon]|nr:prefoldin subunit beta [Methanomicrobiales archaeon]
MDNIPMKVQNQIAMLQQLQQQLQTVITQKAQYDLAVREAKRAQEALKDLSDEAEIFMNIGTVLVQQKKQKVDASLAEKIETLELRIKSLEKQEKAMQVKFEQLSGQVKEALEAKKAPSVS